MIRFRRFREQDYIIMEIGKTCKTSSVPRSKSWFTDKNYGTIKEKRSGFSWKVDKFSCCFEREGPSRLFSPAFSIKCGKQKIIWQLCLTVNPAQNKIGLSLVMLKRNYLCTVETSASLQLKIQSEVFVNICIQRKIFHPMVKQGLTNIKLASQILEGLRARNKNSVTVFCSVGKQTVIQCSNSVGEKTLPCIVQNYENLFLSGQYHDLILICKDQKFRVHKAIIANISEAFASLITTSAQDESLDVITIKDMEPMILKELLRFVYCGKVQNLEDYVFDLLLAAVKFNISSLQIVCHQFIVENFDNGDSIDILNFAETHSLNLLQNDIVNLIIQNLTDSSSDNQMNKIKDLDLFTLQLVVKNLVCKVE